MNENGFLKRKFRIEFNEVWFSRHIGMFFCIEPIDITGKRDIYFLIGLWKHDLSIGFITKWED